MNVESLIAHYRCPERFAKFNATTSLNTEPVFELENARIALTRNADGNGRASLDVGELAKHLQQELYLEGNPGRYGPSGLVRDIYYTVRPLLPPKLRRILQKSFLRKRHLSFPAWPVDTSLETFHASLMAEAIRQNGGEPIPFIWFWPENASSALVMTHDVETARGLESVAELMELDMSHAIRASYQLIPEARYQIPAHLIAQIRAAGNEVNVHDLRHDGRLYSDIANFPGKAEKVNRHVEDFGAQGFRAACMYRRPEWYSNFKFSYDMSIPNVALWEPQPGGCCTVFPYFIGDILELPLTTTEDYTLFSILDETSISLWRTQADLILARNGLVSFLVHPDYILGETERQYYRELLEHITALRDRHGAWIALPGQVNSWWRQRSKMVLKPTYLGWKIEGEGSERASVAYASLENGRVSFRLRFVAVAGLALRLAESVSVLF